MFNQVILLGRLTRPVELRTTQNGKQVASASLATSKRFKDSNGQMVEQSEFHNLVIWQGADNFSKYLTKGSKVQVIGELKTTDWTGQDGVKRYKTEIVVNQFLFLDSKSTENTKPIEEDTQEEEIKVEDIPF